MNGGETSSMNTMTGLAKILALAFAGFFVVSYAAAEPDLTSVQPIHTPITIWPKPGWEVNCELRGGLDANLSSVTIQIDGQELEQTVMITSSELSAIVTIRWRSDGSVIDVQSTVDAPGLPADEFEGLEQYFDVFDDRMANVFESAYGKPLVTGQKHTSDAEARELLEEAFPEFQVTNVWSDYLVRGLVNDGTNEFVLIEGSLGMTMSNSEREVRYSTSGQSLIHAASGYYWELRAEQQFETAGEVQTTERSSDCEFAPALD